MIYRIIFIIIKYNFVIAQITCLAVPDGESIRGKNSKENFVSIANYGIYFVWLTGIQDPWPSYWEKHDFHESIYSSSDLFHVALTFPRGCCEFDK